MTEPSTILDAILPMPAGNASPKAKAVVSTKRKNYETIPRSALLAELGKRVKNVRNYQEALGAGASALPKFDEFEKQWLDRAATLAHRLRARTLRRQLRRRGNRGVGP